MSKHLVIIDGMGFVFRAYHAVRGNLSRSSDGMPTNALFGFAQMLVKVVDELKPDMCVVALDAKGGNWRHKMYPEYKANRTAPDEALVRQLPFVQPLVKAFGLPVLCEVGFEADDIIATLVKQKLADKVTIVTSDKDLLQLVGDGVQLLDTFKDKFSGPAEAVEKFGVGPELVADVQGLMGDSSDNIPGVPGVGPKTAGELVAKLGGLDAIYGDLSKVERDTLRAKLEEHREKAFLSRELARLKDDMVWEGVDLTFHPKLHEAAGYLREELEFGTLANRLEKRGTGVAGKATGVPDDRKSVWRPVVVDEVAVQRKAEGAAWGNYECVQDMAHWKAWLADVKAAGRVAFDTETTGLDPYTAELVGVSLSIGAGKACYVPVVMAAKQADPTDLFGTEVVRGPHGVKGLEILADMKALLGDATIKKIGHNLKYDWLVLARALGITPAETDDGLQKLVVNYEDTMLMSACLDGGRWGHGMDDLVERHLGHKMIAFTEVAGKGKAQVTFDAVELSQATAYAAEDADATYRMWELFDSRLTAETAEDGRGVKYVYEQVERPLLPVIVALEARGVRVDEDELARLSEDFAARMKVFEARIWELAGHEFNVQSTQQLAVVLFDELGAGTEKHKKNRSTAVDILEEIAGQEGTKGALIAQVIGEYRQLAKLKSTYADALVKQVNPLTGRVHTSYQQVGAATGRFSSNDPNLQNIPIRTEEGRKIRHAFVAGKKGSDWVMVSADYSQIELRLLSHFAGSEPLRQAFREGFDIHAYTASLVRGIAMSEVTKEQRRAAKFINFGLVYGMGARSLAGQIGCSMSEAQEWIEAYFKRYDGVRDYMEHNKQFARERGYVETLCGRRVWLPEITSTHGGLRAGAERAAINAPLQGSNADVIKLAMPEVEQAVRGMPVRLLMQVHDELVLECAPEAVAELKVLLPKVMGGVVDLSVPLAVEVGVGPNWESAH